MQTFLISLFGASWRTTLTGYATALFIIVEPIITNGDFEIKRDWKKCVVAVLVSIYGNISKDKHVTGGTQSNTESAAAPVPQKTGI